MKSIKIIFGLVVLSGFGFLIWDSLLDSGFSFGPPKRIAVTVKLENLCEVSDNAFVVREPKSKAMSYFKNGVAYMNLYSDRKIMLEVSPKYPGFEYSILLVPVAPEVTLVADCSVSPRQGRIINLMREQFKQ
ncbi:hypothetical protein N9M50_01760 [Alphaproteobacteria bacterium]|nr:hypothetical protein [Alphaproteobacteria bacterium]